MTNIDIVAELDRWHTEHPEHKRDDCPWCSLLQRARDEIVATNTAIGKAAKEAYTLGRTEALEEAAQVVEMLWRLEDAEDVATSIRILKEKKG